MGLDPEGSHCPWCPGYQLHQAGRVWTTEQEGMDLKLLAGQVPQVPEFHNAFFTMHMTELTQLNSWLINVPLF